MLRVACRITPASFPVTRRLSLSLAKSFRQQSTLRSIKVVMAGKGKQELDSTPGATTKPDPATKGFVMNQTMYRVRDPAASVDFYSRILGMQLINRLDFEEAKFSLYFLAYESHDDIPDNFADRIEWQFSRKATVELTHNWGTESDPNFKGYHNGNDEPQGYGHIGIDVPDVAAACKRFSDLGVSFQKRPEDGRMKSIAFIKDPDGYWIEIFNSKASRAMAES
ncbi:hypothetical protein WJX74_004564 [Apatococcus lobatus]|uniref:Lactoylglutathione lyase n=2 Tax=Apatococcus TaxID=904362 RepID=A0AAW1T6L1_9CHLO